jgi:hypothetical protein
MIDLESLLSGVISSIIGGALLIIIVPILSKKFKYILIWVFGNLIGFDVQVVFNTRKEAEEDLKMEISKSHIVKIFTTRGNELKNNTYANAFKSKSKSRVQLILPSVDSSTNSYLSMRERELVNLSELDSHNTSMFYKNSLFADVLNNIKYFANSKSNIELVVASAPLIGRIVILEQTSYFTIYRDDNEGSNCKTIKCARGSDMYHFLDRYFNQVWEQNVCSS